jgi:Helix-turn-helix domain of resolvase
MIHAPSDSRVAGDPGLEARTAPECGQNKPKGRPPESGKLKVPRKRGPRSRFMTQRDLQKEQAAIINLLSKGAKVADVAEAVDISVATLYRRIGKVNAKDVEVAKLLVPEMAEALKALLMRIELEQQRAMALASKRIEKINSNTSCCAECRNDKIAIRLLELSNKQHVAQVRILKQIGYFEEVRRRMKGLIAYQTKLRRRANRAIDRYLQALSTNQPYIPVHGDCSYVADHAPVFRLHTVQHMIDVLGTSDLKTEVKAPKTGKVAPKPSIKTKADEPTQH